MPDTATALLFPGQGSQVVGMGADLLAESPRARDLFALASEVLGIDLADVCRNGPPERLEATDVQQPAIFAVSVALLEELREQTGGGLAPAAAAGLSLGEYTALYAAGSIDFATGLRLLQARGRFMQEASEKYPGAMVSVMGLDAETVRAVCSQASTGEARVAPANFNAPGQVVVSGDAEACRRAAEEAEKRGGRAVPLKVAGAFHSHLMAEAARRLGDLLAGVPFREPAFPVVSNVTARYHAAAAEIPDLLLRQVTHPVRWQECIEFLIGEGVGRFIEIGPGRVLTGLLRRIDRTRECLNVSTLEAVRRVAGQIRSVAQPRASL